MYSFLKTLTAITMVVMFGYGTAKAETRDIVAVIDTGHNLYSAPRLTPYMCVMDHIDLTGNGIEDVHGHGTNILGIIAKYIDPKRTCLLSVKFYHRNGTPDDTKRVAKAIEQSIKVGAKYINMSLSGSDYSKKERDLIEEALKKNIRVIVASGNDGINMDKNCNTFPACYSFKPNSTDPVFKVTDLDLARNRARRFPFNLENPIKVILNVSNKKEYLKNVCGKKEVCFLYGPQLNLPFFVVTSVDADTSNHGGTVNAVAPGFNQFGLHPTPMTGTSQAAANFTGTLVNWEYP
jgi:subtilisin family serine protease